MDHQQSPTDVHPIDRLQSNCRRGEAVLVVRRDAQGAVELDVVYFRAVSGIAWSDQAGNGARTDDIVAASKDALQIAAFFLSEKVGVLAAHAWREALYLAFTRGSERNGPYGGRYNGKDHIQIAMDFVARLAAGGRIERHGTQHVVVGG